MKDDDNKSLLHFYDIPYKSIIDMSIKDIWDRYVMKSADGVCCRNIFSFDMHLDSLVYLVKNIDNKSDLFSGIRSEYEYGANVVFVSHPNGEPVYGFLLNDLFFEGKSNP